MEVSSGTYDRVDSSSDVGASIVCLSPFLSLFLVWSSLVASLTLFADPTDSYDSSKVVVFITLPSTTFSGTSELLVMDAT